jgi:hypothetical protein
MPIDIKIIVIWDVILCSLVDRCKEPFWDMTQCSSVETPMFQRWLVPTYENT